MGPGELNGAGAVKSVLAQQQEDDRAVVDLVLRRSGRLSASMSTWMWERTSGRRYARCSSLTNTRTRPCSRSLTRKLGPFPAAEYAPSASSPQPCLSPLDNPIHRTQLTTVQRVMRAAGAGVLIFSAGVGAYDGVQSFVAPLKPSWFADAGSRLLEAARVEGLRERDLGTVDPHPRDRHRLRAKREGVVCTTTRRQRTCTCVRFNHTGSHNGASARRTNVKSADGLIGLIVSRLSSLVRLDGHSQSHRPSEWASSDLPERDPIKRRRRSREPGGRREPARLWKDAIAT